MKTYFVAYWLWDVNSLPLDAILRWDKKVDKAMIKHFREVLAKDKYVDIEDISIVWWRVLE